MSRARFFPGWISCRVSKRISHWILTAFPGPGRNDERISSRLRVIPRSRGAIGGDRGSRSTTSVEREKAQSASQLLAIYFYCCIFILCGRFDNLSRRISKFIEEAGMILTARENGTYKRIVFLCHNSALSPLHLPFEKSLASSRIRKRTDTSELRSSLQRRYRRVR